MAKGGGAKGGGRSGGPKGGRKPAVRRGPAGGSPQRAAKARPARVTTPAPDTDVRPVPEAVASVFRLGFVPGATPGKWISLWRDRVPHVPLELVPLTVDAQLDALRGDEVDAAIVRLPLEADDVHRIALYEEIPVVVVAADSALTVADDLGIDDLVGEVLLVPADDVLAADIPGTLAAAPGAPLDTEAAVATVAAGVGILVVPMSIARLHARKDVAHRPLRDGPVSAVALAWPAERTTPEVETFIGIVRGRTANSSR